MYLGRQRWQTRLRPKPKGVWTPGRVLLVVAFVALLLIPDTLARIILGVLLALALVRVLLPAASRAQARQSARQPAAPLSVPELHRPALRAGGGAYLATDDTGQWLHAPPQSGVPVLVGSRAGKTSGVVIPALAAHPAAEMVARDRASDWQQAQLAAGAMTGAADVDPNAGHWTERAAALIASLLYAAARSGQGIATTSSTCPAANTTRWSRTSNRSTPPATSTQPKKPSSNSIRSGEPSSHRWSRPGGRTGST